MLDFDGPWSTQPHPLSNPAWIPKSGVKTFFNAPPMPSSILANHLKSLKSGESIVTEADPPSRIDLMFSIGQQARWREFMGDDDRIYPMRMVQKKVASELPPLFIYHGRDDAALPVEGSEIFVEELRKAGVRDERVVFKVQPGDHGFCNQAELEEAWLKEGLALVGEAWLA
jgi:acetyl esterase/lipase